MLNSGTRMIIVSALVIPDTLTGGISGSSGKSGLQ